MQKTKKKSEIKLTKYMNLLNDWGFKYVFGKKKYLIHFLNLVFQGKEEIKEIFYLSTEQLGKTEEDRKAIFDIYCENERGELILLEMQNIVQAHFEDRSLFYSTFPIQNQAIKGDWDFKLKSVYFIGILNFVPTGKVDSDYIERVYLVSERTQKLFSDRLNFIYIVLPKFNKVLEELKDELDYWLYILKHSKSLELQPEELQEKFFIELLEFIEIERLKGKNMKAYRNSELRYEDLYNFTSYAEQVGMKKGLLEGEMRGRKEGLLEGEKQGKKEVMESKRQISKKLLEMGMSLSDISNITGLTSQQIQQIEMN
jgi:predicted transposase/invertase (TIGR01784 family)